jgi:hypothetical protein
MHCPTCGQQQVSDETRFCSRCGFLLTGVAQLVANKGIAPSGSTGFFGAAGSKKRRDAMQGVFIFLLTFLVVPILAMISLGLRLGPFLPVMGAFLFGIGGLLRTVYALMFESGEAGIGSVKPASLASQPENRGALPSSHSVPASVYASPGSWRDTNELQHHEPDSVTDTTTKLLQKEERDQ